MRFKKFLHSKEKSKHLRKVTKELEDETSEKDESKKKEANRADWQNSIPSDWKNS